MGQFFDPSAVVLSDLLCAWLFKALFVISQISGVLMLMFIIIWVVLFEEYVPGTFFNVHPVMMSCTIFFLGVAILLFRVFRFHDKPKVKRAHIILHSIAIVVMLGGSVLVFHAYQTHDDPPNTGHHGPKPFLRYSSFHTWLGIGTMTLYLVQYLTGLIVYSRPGLSIGARKAVMPCHQFIGVTIFCAALFAASFGTSQRASWKSLCYARDNSGLHMVSNLFAISFLVYGTSVLLLVCNPRWARDWKTPSAIVPGSAEEFAGPVPKATGSRESAERRGSAEQIVRSSDEAKPR